MKYYVEIKEVWARTVCVEADSIVQARDKAKNLDISCDDDEHFEFSHYISDDMWNVFDEDYELLD